ncbi:MAG TPA: lysine 2,3-aminomutase, partial [Thermoanaerobaculia bacterium]|nr:lysine 2,3-aminomutase [Thermoanaerobaculia bacterium]
HQLWSRQVHLGMIPYYMFMQRDTGARDYFGVPLARALAIHHQARENLSGLARTARGPIMSASPGKIEVLGTLEIGDQRYFSLRFIQAREKEWDNRHFIARHSATARWINELTPAFDEPRFFFEGDE